VNSDGIGFAITGFDVTATYIDISGGTIEVGDVVTLTYVGPSAESAAGNPLNEFTNLPVTNSVGILWTDGIDTFRLTARNGFACLDQAITATGFDGDQPGDWDNIWEKKVVVTADGTIITVDSTIFLGDNF